jgi:hypothetical protein
VSQPSVLRGRLVSSAAAARAQDLEQAGNAPPSMILTDAVDQRLIPANPVHQRRRRGRRSRKPITLQRPDGSSVLQKSSSRDNPKPRQTITQDQPQTAENPSEQPKRLKPKGFFTMWS